MQELSLKPSEKNISQIAVIMFAFAIILRFAIGVLYYNSNDTLWYRDWAVSLPDGFFNVYARRDVIGLDYPPVYLFLLYITGLCYRIVGINAHNYMQMFLLKFWPIVTDVLCAFVLYKIFGKYQKTVGLIVSFMWLFNPSVIFNCAFWGQTDGLMCLLLFVSFYALLTEKPLLACCLFAVAGLTKYQCLFFTPVFLSELFIRFKFKKSFKGIIVAALTVAVVFIPFMIGSKDPFLFFNLYLGGQNKYPHCTLNAFNIYGVFLLNWIPDAEIILFGKISLNTLSNILTVLIVIGSVLISVFAKRKSMWITSFLLMSTLFMFTTRMHERYLFPVLVFLLAAAFLHKNKKFAIIFVLYSLTTFLNQIIPMMSWNTEGSAIIEYYTFLLMIMSVLGFGVYLYSTAVSLDFLFDLKLFENNTAKGEVR